MSSLTLVVMAAGMGSRFGGLKQIEPVGPNGEIIADYSVYDALKAGYDKVVFIIRKENKEYFEKNIINKYAGKIKVELAYQELDIMVPIDAVIPEGRVKMLGTGHAVLCAEDKIDGNFVVLNGDDFYGYDAFVKAKEFFDNNPDDNEYVTVNYPMDKVLSPNGSVKRGVCLEKDGYIYETIESSVKRENGQILAKPLAGGDEFVVSDMATASMNFMGFQKSFFKDLKEEFSKFIHGQMSLDNEFLMPDILANLIKEGKMKGKVKTAGSSWMGITYKEDLPALKEHISKMIADGNYPEKLW